MQRPIRSISSKRKPAKARRMRSLQIQYPNSDFAPSQRPVEEVKLTPFSLFAANYYNGAGAGMYLTDLTAVAQGASGAQRVGDHLFAKYLFLRIGLYNGVGAAANNRTVTRMFVFQYFGDGSVAGKPIISDFLQASAANAGATYGSYSSYDIDYGRQYRILWDSGPVVTLGTNGVAAIGVSPRQVFYNVDHVVDLRPADRNIAFYTGGTTGPNHIYFMVTADTISTATNPTLTYNAELRFTDV